MIQALGRDDMRQHEHHVVINILAGLFGALVPASVLDTGSKIAIAFGCGFATLAGQTLWRACVRFYRRLRK